VNSSADEHSPFPLPHATTDLTLYFSSFRAGGFAPDPVGAVAGDGDLYMSEWKGGTFGAPVLVPGVNSESTDGQPNVRRDGREIFFFSTRPGGAGDPDIWSATRERTSEPWSEPVNPGTAVNSPAGESRPSLSWDGRTLYFGSTRPGGDGEADIHVTTRSRVTGLKP
jgi:Tol biopolymer transport system component